jgi:hypothetical protein
MLTYTFVLVPNATVLVVPLLVGKNGLLPGLKAGVTDLRKKVCLELF